MLQVEDIHTFYGESHALQGVSLEIGAGDVVCLLGRNGAGKSTTLKSIIGLTPPRQGRVVFEDEDVTGWPAHRIARRGIALVPEDRRIFPGLTVYENLEVAMNRRPETGARRWAPEQVLDAYPMLAELRDQDGATLSGGQQQMLAIARALVRDIKLLLLDEPYEGLAPVVRHDIERALIEVREAGITTILVEQNAVAALKLADSAIIMDTGEIVYRGTAKHVLGDEALRHEYLAI